MLTLVMENGNGNTPSVNTYADIATADAYHLTSLYSNGYFGGAAWSGYSDDNKALALVTATRTLDAEVDWFGKIYNQQQPLCWPRSLARDPDKSESILPAPAISLFGPYWPYDAVPQPVQDCCCELAWWLLRGDRTKEFYEGVSQFNIGQGAVSATIDKGDRPPPIPDYVGAMLRRVGCRTSALGRGNKSTSRRVTRG